LRVRVPVFVVLAVVVGLFAWRFYSDRSSSAPVTVGDVAKLEERYKSSGSASPDDALPVLQGYAAMTTKIGDMAAAVRVTRELLERDPKFASLPKVKASAEKMDREWAILLQKAGMPGEAAWSEFLARGISFANEVVGDPKLSEQQRAVALLCRAKILFQSRYLDEAMRDATESLRLNPNGVLANLVRADVCSERKQYSAAMQEMRAASMKLQAWSREPPPWEMRIALAMMRPRRAVFRERRWRERRTEIAGLLSSQIQSEISVLQGLERVEMHGR
jgi:hypothetical protein